MPTGYTACVEDGTVTDFKTFATRCLRAMGCCIMQRDDGMDEPPKHQKPSTYHSDAWAKANLEYDRIRALTETQIREEMKAEHDRAVTYRDEYLASNATENARFDAMAAHVQAWVPPSPGHENFKAFMLEQLRISRHSGNYSPDVPKSQTPEEWRKEKIAQCFKDMAYHRKEDDEEKKRCADSNAWMDAAIASFSKPSTCKA